MKINRNYRFVLTVVNESETVEQENRPGEFMFESECHYYCEKEIISAIKAAEKIDQLQPYNEHIYCIYKEEKPRTEKTVYEKDGKKITEETEIPGKAVLIETITVKGSEIIIR